jgi:hypothetical protein
MITCNFLRARRGVRAGSAAGILAGIPQMTPELREYYCFSFFPGRQTRGADGYRHPRAARTGGRAADLAIFPGIGTVRSGGIALTMSLCSATGSWAAANSIASGIPSNFSQISATIAASASVSSNSSFHEQSAGKLRASASLWEGSPAVTDGARVRPRCVTARGWSHARRPPERVDGQSRSGLDYMLAVVKHQQHLPPYASVVTTTESEVTEITET